MATKHKLFGEIADALSAIAEKHGYTIHANTSSESISLTKEIRSNSFPTEEDIRISIRRAPAPPKPRRRTKAQLEQELAETKERNKRLLERTSTRREYVPDYSYFGYGDGPT